MSAAFDQIFYMPSNRVDQGLLDKLLGCLDSLPLGFPTETEGLTVMTFLIHYEVEGDGNCLAITGSIPELGRWQLSESVRAQRLEAAGPNWWFAQFKVQCSTTFTWRWVVVCPDNHAVRMEERAERHTGVFFKPSMSFTAWNGEEKSVLNEELRAMKKIDGASLVLGILAFSTSLPCFEWSVEDIQDELRALIP